MTRGPIAGQARFQVLGGDSGFHTPGKVSCSRSLIRAFAQTVIVTGLQRGLRPLTVGHLCSHTPKPQVIINLNA